MSKISLEELVNYLKNLGYVYQGSEIYGGLANSWDFGPLGVELKNNIKKCWWKKFIQESKDNVGLDSAILMNKKVWEATGHVSSFNDPLMDCKECNTRFRADKLIEDFTKGQVNGDGMTNEELFNFIKEKSIPCPNCGKHNFSEIRQFNMMFKTNQGVINDESNVVYLRPETAQGIFINFKNIQRSLRKKVPFGVGQIGKAFRNEITPGNFIFRTREFEQMEFEFFCKPGTEIEWFNFYREYCLKFLLNLGVKKENLRYRDHETKELAFYSNATTDIEYQFPWGFGEVWGIASRTDYDLKSHQNYSNESFLYLDPDTNEKYIPYVVEPSVGVERIMLTVLFDAYDIETLENNEKREVLRLHPALAPYKVAVLPLIKKYHSEYATKVYEQISKYFMATYDDTQNIGKRYRRQDAIGTPYVVTIDDNSLNNDEVTIRNRDTMEQVTIKADKIVEYLNEKLVF